MCGDSAEVSLLPTITRCWTRIGQQRVIPTPGVKAEKRWDWGAVNVVTGESIHRLHARRNNVGLRRLLYRLAKSVAYIFCTKIVASSQHDLAAISS